MKRSSMVSLACLLTLGAMARADDPAIVINKARPVIVRQTFDPRHLPPKMPPLVPGEAGLCHYEFTTDIQAGGDVDETGPGQVNITVDSVLINLSLPITIFLAPNAPARIKEHEEGHRSICEYYYTNIDVYARRAAQPYIGKTFSGQGKDKQSAVDNALDKIISAISKQIMEDTRMRCVACNDRYDAITDHSRNPGSQAEAAAKAEAGDPEPAGGRPAATQPSADANN